MNRSSVEKKAFHAMILNFLQNAITYAHLSQHLKKLWSGSLTQHWDG